MARFCVIFDPTKANNHATAGGLDGFFDPSENPGSSKG
jgi:hypothetical protein